jgi:hypothetical protein
MDGRELPRFDGLCGDLPSARERRTTKIVIYVIVAASIGQSGINVTGCYKSAHVPLGRAH